ncbi:MAG: A24 family peptidase [Myxococcales bacterium]|nr:A24 family peptidase [Myxococcales bacterium]
MDAQAILHAIAVLVAAIAATSDWRRGEIPNWLTLPPLLIAPLAYALIWGRGAALLSIGGLFVCGLVPFLLWRRHAMGGGDVKLFASIGAISGVLMGVEMQLVAFVVASVYALGRLAWEGNLLRTLGNSFFLALNPFLPRRHRREVSPSLMSTLRMGGPILVGTVLSAIAAHPELFL